MKSGVLERVKLVEVRRQVSSWLYQSTTTESKKSVSPVFLKLEDDVLVCCEESNYEKQMSRLPAIDLRRIDMKTCQVHAEVQRYQTNENGKALEKIQLCLVLSTEKEEDLCLTSNLEELHSWWKAFSKCRSLALHQQQDEEKRDDPLSDDDDCNNDENSAAAAASASDLSDGHLKQDQQDEGPPPSLLDQDDDDKKQELAKKAVRIADNISIFGAVYEAFDEVLRCVIRPPRSEYSLTALGPDVFPFYGFTVTRTDFVVRNKRGQRLMCSRWLPRNPGGGPFRTSNNDIYSTEETPTVVYVHGNASSRAEAVTPILATCLSIGASLCAFDTAGSGLSDGDHVSLGYFEQDDLEAVVDYLRYKFGVEKIGLWGRSMGAATCLLYASRLSPDAVCLIADSSFASLRGLCLELIQRTIAPNLPLLTFEAAVNHIATSVRDCAGFDLNDVEPAACLATNATPVLIIHGRRDELVDSEHATTIIDSFDANADVQLLLEPRGTHASPRTIRTVCACRRFLSRHLFAHSHGRCYRRSSSTSAVAGVAQNHQYNDEYFESPSHTLPSNLSSPSLLEHAPFIMSSARRVERNTSSCSSASYEPISPHFFPFGDGDEGNDDSSPLPMDDRAFLSRSITSLPWSSVWRNTAAIAHKHLATSEQLLPPPLLTSFSLPTKHHAVLGTKTCSFIPTTRLNDLSSSAASLLKKSKEVVVTEEDPSPPPSLTSFSLS